MRAESAVEPTKVREHHRDLAAFGGFLAASAPRRQRAHVLTEMHRLARR